MIFIPLGDINLEKWIESIFPLTKQYYLRMMWIHIEVTAKATGVWASTIYRYIFKNLL